MVAKNSFHSKRYAFTMIELIFAIVIIAIAVLSLPRMNATIQKGVENGMAQEAIFAASSELMSSSAGYWDENSMQDISISQFSRVINVGGDCNASTNLRKGHVAQSFHRRCLDNNTTTPSDTAGGSVVDLDDIVHTTATDIFLNYTADSTGYKNAYKSTLTISRANDIKTLVSTITDSSGNIITVLRLQSANIGEIDYYKRTMF